MNLLLLRGLLGFFLLLNGVWVSAEVSIDASSSRHGTAIQKVDIDVFIREGCPHCAKADEFLQALQQEQPRLNIILHDINKESGALQRLQAIAAQQQTGMVRVPAFYVGGQLIIGYSDAITTGQLIREALRQQKPAPTIKKTDADSCEAASLACEAPVDTTSPATATPFRIDFLGHTLSLEDIGLPLFTVAMGLLDGFNPCSLWVLILMISLLAPMQNRLRMFVIAGTFVAVEGIAYFIFMAAWLNIFLLVGLSRLSEIIIAVIALVAGLINLKDFWFFGWGVSLSIPNAAKPGIYARMRRILTAQNLTGAMLGAVLLAVLVQVVEFMCTSGFPALYTRILTLSQLSAVSYYSYLLLYNLAYMFDDMIILGIGIVTLSQRRLQEKEGRWLKLISGGVMLGLGIYLLLGLN
ncbi:MAG: NrdH-redoxin [Methylococcales bacterium]|nr:NrdH-redoxin [Methylococcales bacterium]